MNHFQVNKFKATIEIIGINPFVFVPEEVLQALFKQSGKEKGHILVKGLINKKPYKQTLLRYAGHWRLYISNIMLNDSPKKIGEEIEITITFNPDNKETATVPAFTTALNKTKVAKITFERLSPSRQDEIVRYLAKLKSEEALARNIEKALLFLTGKGSFVGRNKP